MRDALKPVLVMVDAVVLVDTMFYAALTPLLPHYAQGGPCAASPTGSTRPSEANTGSTRKLKTS
jgi:hypothetical protein